MSKMTLLSLICVWLGGMLSGYNVGYAVCKTRYKSVRVENNLFVPVTTNAMVLETNEPTLPDGFKLIRSDDGIWKWESESGYRTTDDFATRRDAIESARGFYDYRARMRGRTWTEVK